MTSTSAPAAQGSKIKTKYILGGLALAVLLAMAFSTKVVKIGSADDQQKKVFSKEAYGTAEFPNVQKWIIEHAVDAKTLSEALTANRAEASKKYGVEAGLGPVFPITFSGVAGDSSSGVYKVKVDGLPDDVLVRVQTGPAINGTELRDASGEIMFGAFTNQIEFQNAGSALNDELKKQVLSKIDNSNLIGKKLSVIGVFKLINPKGWLVTPVKITVE